MLSTLLTSLTSLRDFLSRAFLIGAFLPALLFTFLTFLGLYLWTWPVHNWLEDDLLSEKAPHRVVVFTAMFMGLWIEAYLVGALTPYWRRILEGRTWQWRWLRNLGIRYQQARYKEIDDGINTAVAVYAKIARERPQWRQSLRAAAAGGMAAGPGASPATLAIIQTLRDIRASYGLITFEDLDGAYQNLIGDVTALGPVPGLQRLAEELGLLVNYADDRAKSEHSRLATERRLNFGSSWEIAPTQFGNVGLSAQAYAMRAYNCNLELIWGALRQATQKDEKLAPALEDSKMQLDFLVASFFLFDIWCLAWAVIFACSGVWLWAVVLAIAGPLVGWGVWYGAAVERYRVLQDLITSLLDSLRFQVLTNSHLNTPVDLEEERELWRALDLSVGAGQRDKNLRYRPGTPS